MLQGCDRISISPLQICMLQYVLKVGMFILSKVVGGKWEPLKLFWS